MSTPLSLLHPKTTRRTHSLVDSCLFPAWLADENLVRTGFNSVWLDHAGRTVEEEAGGGWLERVHPEDLHGAMEDLEKAASGLSEFQLRYRLRNSLGEYRFFMDSGFPLRDAEDRVIGFSGFAMDAQHFTRGLAEMQRLHQVETELAHVLAHDLRAPLRAIEGFTEAIREDAGERLTGEIHEFLDEISGGAVRLRRLIEDLVVLLRIGREQISPGRVEVSTLLAEVLQSRKQSIESCGARVRVEAGNGWILGRKRPLLLLLEALLDNALKFHRSHHPPEITIRAEVRGAEWIFRIEDQGIGIPPEHAEEVFQVFRKLHLPSEYPGSGAGLALARRVVDLHHGWIHIDANPGGGAVVEFGLPRMDAPRIPNDRESPANQ